MRLTIAPVAPVAKPVSSVCVHLLRMKEKHISTQRPFYGLFSFFRFSLGWNGFAFVVVVVVCFFSSFCLSVILFPSSSPPPPLPVNADSTSPVWAREARVHALFTVVVVLHDNLTQPSQTKQKQTTWTCFGLRTRGSTSLHVCVCVFTVTAHHRRSRLETEIRNALCAAGRRKEPLQK